MYKQVYAPNHHRADITGLVSEHILVAEKELGRPLKKGEIVHHKDFDKFNNDEDNLLFPISRAEHQKLPEYQAKFLVAKGLYASFLAWWRQEKIHDAENVEIREIERKLVKAQNEKQRLLGRMKLQNENLHSI